jgi:hypothetical protein
METIVPRREWRTFAASFGDADRRFRGLPPGKVRESDANALEPMQAQLTHPSRGIRAVPIHRKRQRYTVGG